METYSDNKRNEEMESQNEAEYVYDTADGQAGLNGPQYFTNNAYSHVDFGGSPSEHGIDNGEQNLTERDDGIYDEIPTRDHVRHENSVEAISGMTGQSESDVRPDSHVHGDKARYFSDDKTHRPVRTEYEPRAPAIENCIHTTAPVTEEPPPYTPGDYHKRAGLKEISPMQQQPSTAQPMGYVLPDGRVVLMTSETESVPLPQRKPPDYFVLACVTLCINCFMGIPAMLLSCESKKNAKKGDMERARYMGKVSLGLSVAGMILTATIVFVVLMFVVGDLDIFDD